MTVHVTPDETHYVHRAVLLQHVGGTLKPFIAAEPIDKKDPHPRDREAGHEGELMAAKRLLTRVAGEYGKRFIDILTCDALYMNYPFARHCAQLGWYLSRESRTKEQSYIVR